MPQTENGCKLLTVPEAAMQLQMSAPSLRRLIDRGLVPIIQPGGPRHAIRIRSDDIERLVTAKPKVAA
jgi:excisionase family DNA binding protein